MKGLINMTFWEKFWKLVSLKHLFFGILVFVLVIAMSFIEAQHRVRVDLGEAEIVIRSSRYTMTVPYDMIESAQLLPLAEAGTVIDGTDNMTIRTGTWENTIWGEYSVCADLSASNCVALRLTDGRMFVFSRTSNEETEEIYLQMISKLGS